jgi:beta-glucanase (GH16 family)
MTLGEQPMSKQRFRASVSLATLALVGVTVTTTSSDALTVTRAAARPHGVMRLTPPIVQPGTTVAAAGAARLSGNAQFWPVRHGRPVLVQRRLPGQSWHSVAELKENRAGVVHFTGPATSKGRPYSYRGVARPYRGAARVFTTGVSSAEWKTKFSDQFSGTALDTRRWGYRAPGQLSPTRTRAVSSPSAVGVRDGSLRLHVKKDPRTAGRYLNGHVGTQAGRFSFTYGVASARIKFERYRGQHGAFWLVPDTRRSLVGQPGRSGAEIDAVEFFGQGASNGGLGSFVYNYGILDPGGAPKRLGAVWPAATANLPTNDAWWKRYHVFTVQWTPTRYVFRVDGRPHWTTGVGVSAVPEYLVLSLLTSDYELPRLPKGRLPTAMHVDWVRVWQR